VGIGTTAPTEALEVAGNVRVAGNVVATGSIMGAGTASSFTAIPTGTAAGQGSLFVNPASAPADNTLFGVALGGAARFRVDAEGDATFTGDIAANNLTLSGAINGGFRVLATTGTPNIIGGFSGNFVSANVRGATIAGGGQTGSFGPNRVEDDYGTVGGGRNNRAGDAADLFSGAEATVGGGSRNTASGSQSTIGGGASNTASGSQSTIGGGSSNTASGGNSTIAGGFGNSAGADAVVGGGDLNAASALWATIPGGRSNTASGQYSFAAGRRAQANHNGAFVWGDSADADVTSAGNNEFVVRATGGVRFVADPGATGTPTLLMTVSSGGTVTAAAFVGDGSGLTNLPGGGITNVIAGSGLTGGGASGPVTLSVDSSVARTNIANNFSGDQTVIGSVQANGVVTGIAGLAAGGGAAITNSDNVAQTAGGPLVITLLAGPASAFSGGQCITRSIAAPGATTSMAVVISPAGNPSTNGLSNVIWTAFVPSNGNVTAQFCKIGMSLAQPVANQNFNVRVLQ